MTLDSAPDKERPDARAALERLDPLDESTRAYLSRTFNDDALVRLARSTQDYYSTHGEYVPVLARLVLEARAANAALTESVAGLSADVTRLEAERAQFLRTAKIETSLADEQYLRRQAAEAQVAELRSALALLADVAAWSMRDDDVQRAGFDNGPWYFNPETDNGDETPWDIAAEALARPPLSGGALKDSLGAAEVRVEELEGRLEAESAKTADVRGRGDA